MTSSEPSPTREQWLNDLVAAISSRYTPYPPSSSALPPVRISVGFTSTGRKSKRIGECWAPTCDAAGACHIFIHPALIDEVDVAATVAHELIHANIGVDQKHGPEFKRVATRLGLTGKMRSTVAGDEFRAWIAPILEELGPYPHGALKALDNWRKTQTTRMIKTECEVCGYTARTTRKWLNEAGAPLCPRCSEPDLLIPMWEVA